MQELFDKILKDAGFPISSKTVTKELFLTQDGNKNQRIIEGAMKSATKDNPVIIKLPEGRYPIRPQQTNDKELWIGINVPSNVTIQGAGQNKTNLYLDDSFIKADPSKDVLYLLRSNNRAKSNEAQQPNGINENITIEGMSLYATSEIFSTNALYFGNKYTKDKDEEDKRDKNIRLRNVTAIGGSGDYIDIDAFRVGKLVDDVFETTKSNENKIAALKAIKLVLKGHLDDNINYKNTDELKAGIVSAIGKVYSSAPDQFSAFMNAVKNIPADKKTELNLADNNPLILHQSHIDGKRTGAGYALDVVGVNGLEVMGVQLIGSTRGGIIIDSENVDIKRLEITNINLIGLSKDTPEENRFALKIQNSEVRHSDIRIRNFDYGNGSSPNNNYAMWIENSRMLKSHGGADPEVIINGNKYPLNFASTTKGVKTDGIEGIKQPGILRIKGDSTIGVDSNIIEHGRGPKDLPIPPKSESSEIGWVLGV